MKTRLLSSLLLVSALAVPAGAESNFPFYSGADAFDAGASAAVQHVQASGLRCGTLDRDLRHQLGMIWPQPEGLPADCSANNTDPTGWDPDETWEIQVVFHIIQHTDGVQGIVPDFRVHEQMEIFNEDFLALPGTNGANGNDSMITFVLASEDPLGDPTTGIVRYTNNTWFNDGGSYWNTIAWDPTRYLNIYSNSAGGFLGYVPQLPADSGYPPTFPGSLADRVVVLWDTIGRDSPYGPPYNFGRTVAHEVGHYLGLEHTFSGSCGGTPGPPGCYSSGDLICDTPQQSGQTFGCPIGATSCSGQTNPIRNYMNYTDDLCMEEFTLEQVNRMRCTLTFYRPDLFQVVNASEIFSDGFESGDTTAW